MTKYGPFSPQELDKMIQWLDDHQVWFDLTKDDQIENKFKANSPSNLIAYSELRTQTYLAQIFFLEVEFLSTDSKAIFEKKFIQKSEVIPIWINKLTRPVSFKQDQAQASFQSKLWASVLFLLWLALIVFYFFRDYSEQLFFLTF